jgi:hypothetical protein
MHMHCALHSALASKQQRVRALPSPLDEAAWAAGTCGRHAGGRRRALWAAALHAVDGGEPRQPCRRGCNGSFAVFRQVRRNPHVEILPLSTGCLGACTYCKTKHARGHLGSYDPEALLARVAQAVRDPLVSGPHTQVTSYRLQVSSYSSGRIPGGVVAHSFESGVEPASLPAV